MDTGKLIHVSKSLKCIAHPDRLKILMLLGCNREMNVSDIQRSVGLTQSMASQHLLAMKEQSVLVSKKAKNKVYYSIGDKNVLKVIDCMKRCRG